jgi:hypothetical protein
VPEANTRASVRVRMLKARRSPQAVACRKRGVEELERPRGFPAAGRQSYGIRAIETRKGKPGNGLMPKPKQRNRKAERVGREVP